MKKFIISYGNFLLNFAVVIEFIAALIISISLISEQGFFISLLIFIGSTILIVLANYFLFLIIDFHACHEKISKSLEIIAQNINKN